MDGTMDAGRTGCGSGRGGRRAGLAFLLIAAALTGCATTSKGPPVNLDAATGAVRFADSPALQEGDLVLTRADNALAALFAGHGATPGPYGHTAMLVLDDQGRPGAMHIIASGLEVVPLGEFASRYARLAVVRLRQPPTPPDAIARSARAWQARNREKPLGFDKSFRAETTANDQFFCLGLLNRIYTDTGAPAPFVLPPDLVHDGWLKWAHRDLGFNIDRTPTASSVLSNPAFTVVYRWENPAANRNNLIVFDELGNYLHERVNAGEELAPPGCGARTMIGVARLSCGLTEQGARVGVWAAKLDDHAQSVRAAVARQERRQPEAATNPEQVRQWAHDACVYYHDQMFLRPPAPAATPTPAPTP